MLVTMITIRIDNTDILDHTVIINYAIWRTAKYRCDSASEYVPSDRLLLESLPPPAVQHADVGNFEGDVLTPQRLYKLGPDHMSKAIDQHFGVFPLRGTGKKFL